MYYLYLSSLPYILITVKWLLVGRPNGRRPAGRIRSWPAAGRSSKTMAGSSSSYNYGYKFADALSYKSGKLDLKSTQDLAI